MRRSWQRLRAVDSRLVDGGLVLALGAPSALTAWLYMPRALVLVALMTVPLLWRRRWPLAVFLAPSAAMMGMGLWARPVAQTFTTFGALLLGAYSMGAYSRHRVSSLALVCAVTVAQIGLIAVSRSSFAGIWFVQVPAFWLVGNSVRAQVSLARERGLRLEQEHDALMRAAATDERARIARDMHDVVAHSVGVMVLQAEAARKQLQLSPERAGVALQSVSAYGREALAELRNMLGLLRDADSVPELDPQPGLADVGTLVERMRGAGVRVELRFEGPVRSLPPGLDLAGYRVVQEALTNALKHAPSASTDVLIRYGDRDVLIEVQDDGSGGRPATAVGARRGLLGMQERVAAYGGRMEAQSVPGQGYRLRVSLPSRGGR